MSTQNPEARTAKLAARKAVKEQKCPMTKFETVVRKKWRGHGSVGISYVKTTYVPTAEIEAEKAQKAAAEKAIADQAAAMQAIAVALAALVEGALPGPPQMSQEALNAAIALEEGPWVEVTPKGA